MKPASECDALVLSDDFFDFVETCRADFEQDQGICDGYDFFCDGCWPSVFAIVQAELSAFVWPKAAQVEEVGVFSAFESIIVGE